jgi:prepilin signal peptidase PulO-like enzyme (type II secretory pathway)
MIIFSVEDIRFKSVPTKWLNLLIILAFIYVIVDVFVLPIALSGKRFICIQNVQIIEEAMSFDLVKDCFFNLLVKIDQIAKNTNFIFFQNEYFIKITEIAIRCILGYLLIGLPYFISRKNGIGSADVIFFTSMAAFFPVEAIWSSYFFTFVSGALLFGIIRIVKPKKRIKTIPLIPFLSFGFFISIFLI